MTLDWNWHGISSLLKTHKTIHYWSKHYQSSDKLHLPDHYFEVEPFLGRMNIGVTLVTIFSSSSQTKIAKLFVSVCWNTNFLRIFELFLCPSHQRGTFDLPKIQIYHGNNSGIKSLDSGLIVMLSDGLRLTSWFLFKNKFIKSFSAGSVYLHKLCPIQCIAAYLFMNYPSSRIVIP